MNFDVPEKDRKAIKRNLSFLIIWIWIVMSSAFGFIPMAMGNNFTYVWVVFSTILFPIFALAVIWKANEQQYEAATRGLSSSGLVAIVVLFVLAVIAIIANPTEGISVSPLGVVVSYWLISFVYNGSIMGLLMFQAFALPREWPFIRLR